MKNKVIEDLTPAQEAQLEVYYRKWVDIGLSAKPTTPEMRKKAEECIATIYQAEGLAIPEFEWVKSPMAGAKRAKEIEGKEAAVTSSCGYGAHDANWLSFYDYMLNELGIEECKELVPLMELATVSGWWWPYEGLCVLSELPVECHINAKDDLHKDGGAAIVYADGFKLYSLNGVEVPEYIAVTPSDKLDPKDVLNEKNAEVRLQGVKKIGPKRLLETLGGRVVDEKTYDAGGTYQLVNVNWTDNDRLYLKMVNPSTGETVIEPVHPECKNVDQALGFRMSSLIGDDWKNKKYTYKKPIIYT